METGVTAALQLPLLLDAAVVVDMLLAIDSSSAAGEPGMSADWPWELLLRLLPLQLTAWLLSSCC